MNIDCKAKNCIYNNHLTCLKESIIINERGKCTSFKTSYVDGEWGPIDDDRDYLGPHKS